MKSGGNAVSRIDALRISCIVVLAAFGLALAHGAEAHAAKGMVGWFGQNGSGAGEWSNPRALDVNLTGNGSGADAGDMYIGDSSNARIQQVDAQGNFIRTWGYGVGPDFEDVFQVCEAPGPCENGSGGSTSSGTAGQGGRISNPTGIAIDQATGNVFVSDTTGRRVSVFSSAGKFFGAFGWDVASAADPGNIGSAAFEFCTTACQRPATTGANAGQFNSPQGIAIDPTNGRILVAEPNQNRLNEFSVTLNGSQEVIGAAFVRAFGWDVANTGDPGDTAPVNQFEICTTVCKIGTTGTGAGQFFSGPSSVAVDSTGAIYALESNSAASHPSRVQKFVPAGPIFGSITTVAGGTLSSTEPNFDPIAIATDAADHLLVIKQMPPGATPVCPATGEPSPEREWRVLEFLADGTPVPANTALECAGFRGNDSHVDQMAVGPTGDIFVATQALGVKEFPFGGTSSMTLFGVMILNTLGSPPTVTIDSVTPTTSGAVVAGKVNPKSSPAYPNPLTVSYQVEYKLASDSGWTPYGTPFELGAGESDIPFSTTVVGLLANTEYDFRVVANRALGTGTTIATHPTITTVAAPPAIHATSSSNWTPDSADLHAVIDPRGSATTYFFEYGTNAAYGQRVPIETENGIGSGQGGVDVTVHIENLQPVTYHFRVVAKNPAGVSVSPDQTFDFYPPDCPNRTLRQQSGASYLPDCRAYEIASPEDAGGVILFPSSAPVGSDATSPSRVGFSAAFGTIPGLSNQPVNTLGDLYVATRGDNGWTTQYIGLPGDETNFMGNPPGFGHPPHVSQAPGNTQDDVLSDPTLSRVLSWDGGNPNISPNPFDSNAPYLFDTDDNSIIDRWPTNLSQVSGGEEFLGQVAANSELTHFVWSSDVPFVPGAAAGAIYLNDTIADTVEVISRKENDDPIEGGQILEVSDDASHVLMRGGSDLHMWSDGQVHDIAPGAAAHHVQMTADGEVVYFLSDAKLESDTDTSTDLYRWEEAGDDITRISTGIGGTGDTDGCNANGDWIARCGVAVVDFGDLGQAPGGSGGNGKTDNFVAEDSGDIYFYSPEQLAGPALGSGGRQNLYLYRDGQVRFVASLIPGELCIDPGFGNQVRCSVGAVGRMQVSPDGDHAAFITESQLTAFPTGGVASMYLYDAEADHLTCVSCPPSGAAPKDEVRASQNGLFMTDDGRPFFVTSDPLMPTDTNASIDVYEYVDGRPQLVSKGKGAPTETEIFQGAAQPGLIGVSADGTDAYFATYEVLIPQDQNGGNLKIYDARSNGGYPILATPAPCEAADECHGPTSDRMQTIVDGTGSTLTGGNAVVERRRCLKAGKRKGKKAKRRGAHSSAKKKAGKKAKRCRRRGGSR